MLFLVIQVKTKKNMANFCYEAQAQAQLEDDLALFPNDPTSAKQ